MYDEAGKLVADKPRWLLAIVQFSHHRTSDVLSAEHFMALHTHHDDRFYIPCGF